MYRYDINFCLEKNSQKLVLKNLQSNLFNTFNYNKDKKYVHFFRYKSFIQYFFDDNSAEGMIISVDIPPELLNKYKGFGFYIVENQEFPIPEYAIPLEEFNEDWIVGLETRQKSNIEHEDFDKYQKYLETIKVLKSQGSDIPSIVADLLDSDIFSLMEDDKKSNTRK